MTHPDTPPLAVVERMTEMALALFAVPGTVTPLYVAAQLVLRFPGVPASFIMTLLDTVLAQIDPDFQPPDTPEHLTAQLAALAEYLRQMEQPQ